MYIKKSMMQIKHLTNKHWNTANVNYYIKLIQLTIFCCALFFQMLGKKIQRN